MTQSSIQETSSSGKPLAVTPQTASSLTAGKIGKVKWRNIVCGINCAPTGIHWGGPNVTWAALLPQLLIRFIS